VKTFIRWAFISSALLCLAVPTRSQSLGSAVTAEGSAVEGKTRITASVAIDNLANKVALYSFLSIFSATHLLQPGNVVARIGLAS
jgi:hypothetical protein